ncbi:sulphite efflux pump protein [Ephemerocybe angulata]|uniref:Sulphite efflux pump protein n=1 Tax=Ephemerocybe angulata TaxID=980116 RepID=A0A8H6IEZ2_9AGAR|nr:sulphite efflux pump protein [Tulosesus angulatus]
MVAHDEKRPPRGQAAKSAVSVFIRKAHPALFTIIMATGIISMLFSEFPYGKNTKAMMILSTVFFFLNLTMMCTFASCFVTKHLLYRDRWRALMRKPTASLYLGAFPMGLCTLLNVSIDVLHDFFGWGKGPYIYFLWGVWWIVAVIGALCCWSGVHAMSTLQKHSLGTMAPSWLLPVTTLTVVASSGSIMANALLQHSPHHALIGTVTSVFLVTSGLCLGLMVLTLYLARLIIYGIPAGGAILSVFLPLGTTGQSGFAFYLAGQNFRAILPYEHAGTSSFLNHAWTGEMLYVVCISSAFVLWTLATMWMIFALLALRTSLKEARPSFGMSFWGLVFPNGVYANLTITLGTAFDSNGFRIFGAVYAVIVFLLWICISFRSFFELEQGLVTENHGRQGRRLGHSERHRCGRCGHSGRTSRRRRWPARGATASGLPGSMGP